MCERFSNPKSTDGYFFNPREELDLSDDEPFDQAQRIDITRRVATVGLVGAAVALGANFLGLTSLVLDANPQLARRYRLDEVYPVDGFKRFVDREDGFEFMYLQRWLPDRDVYLSRQLATDGATAGVRLRKEGRPKPIVAFKPESGYKRENLSLIKTVTEPGLNLKALLGAPSDAASILLSGLAGPGTGRTFTVLEAFEEERPLLPKPSPLGVFSAVPEGLEPVIDTSLLKSQLDDISFIPNPRPSPNPTLQGLPTTPTYVFEFLVQGRDVDQHSITVAMARGNELYTLNMQCPSSRWNVRGYAFQIIAQSFHLFLN